MNESQQNKTSDEIFDICMKMPLGGDLPLKSNQTKSNRTKTIATQCELNENRISSSFALILINYIISNPIFMAFIAKREQFVRIRQMSTVAHPTQPNEFHTFFHCTHKNRERKTMPG